MYYKKVETYTFIMPREHKAYLAFKQQLKDLGQTYTDTGGNMQQEVVLRANGRFEVDDDGVILNIKGGGYGK